MRSSLRSGPLVQYDTPRPESFLGARRARSPSSRCHDHLVAPVPASAAMTHRITPAVKYKVPFTMIGVLSLRYSGGVLKSSDFQRQAMSMLATLARVI